MPPLLMTLQVINPTPPSVAPASTVKVGVVRVWFTFRIPALTEVDTGALRFSSMIQVPAPCLVRDPELLIDPARVCTEIQISVDFAPSIQKGRVRLICKVHVAVNGSVVRKSHPSTIWLETDRDCRPIVTGNHATGIVYYRTPKKAKRLRGNSR